MLDVIFYLAAVMALAVLMIVGAFLLRTYLSGGNAKAAVGQLFRPKAVPRLSVVEQASVDSRRRIVLIRRDNVEHLIMTGGPADVVIETGIGVHEAVGEPAQSAPHPFPARAVGS